jgi:hypothetical protein
MFSWGDGFCLPVEKALVKTDSDGFPLAADGVHVEECPQEQAALSEIWRLRNEGRSMRRIAAALNIDGYRTRRGTDWRLESIARILGNVDAR